MQELNKPIYRLSHSRRLMRWGYSLYKKKGKSLPPEKLTTFESLLSELDHALMRQDRGASDQLAKKLEIFIDGNIKSSFLEHIWENAGSFIWEAGVALVLALVIATIVRAMWFEPYEIPTGSMRPTFKEQDHLTVSKAQFGINVPLEPKHFMFDPNLVQRTGVVTFTAEGLPMRDVDTTCFYILPCKKRLIKRCIAKPGDTLYFYGGKIYGMDKEGNPLSELLNNPWMEKLEHIPFMSFEGEITSPAPQQFLFNHMHLPIGKVTVSSLGQPAGEVFNGKEWVKDQPMALLKPHTEIQTYSDFWGFRNFAMARLLTKEELQNYTDLDTKDLEEGKLYLELRHTPSLTYPKPLLSREPYSHGILLNPFRTVIPLQEKHLQAIMDNMYTARFVVKNGYAYRYSVEGGHLGSGSPRFPGVPDGTYEFYYGKASKVGWGAITYEVPKNSPLYSTDPQNVQKLFNLGIEMNNLFQPHSANQIFFPNRYAYFRDGDLYLLGAPIITKDDPLLVAFNNRELKKEKQASTTRPYISFKDYGPPEKEGKLDKEFLQTFGVKVPDKHYLVLGDNHAMSADSRVFGFVPEDNLQGVPCLILWPPGERWGSPDQKPYPLFVTPRIIIWCIASFILLICWIWHSKRIRKPIFKKIQWMNNSQESGVRRQE